MANSILETQVTWSAATSVTISTNTMSTSDAITINQDTWDASLQVSVDNNGTPTAGDTLDVFVLWSNGDVLGDSGDDFDTGEHSQFLCRLDTVTANTPGEDPARKTVTLPISGKKAFRIGATWNSAAPGTRTATVRARYVEHRAN